MVRVVRKVKEVKICKVIGKDGVSSKKKASVAVGNNNNRIEIKKSKKRGI